MVSLKLLLWLRPIVLVDAIGIASGASLLAYRYYTRPVTLSVAVGSNDGESAKATSALASRLVSTGAPVRLRVIDSGTAFDAAKALAAGNVDLAVMRGDVGDLSNAQAVVVSHVVLLVVALPGSPIDSMDKLKGHRVGVVGGDTNARIVAALSTEYGFDRAKMFKTIGLPEARTAIQSKDVSALLMVIPLAEKYLSLLRDFVQQGSKALPALIPIDSAGAIAAAERAYESFDVPRGTLRGAPPVPDDDLTTLRASLYLVAQKKLGNDLIASLTQTIMRVRRDLMAEQPIFAQIAVPSTDADAYIPLHPGAAAFYNRTQQSFMDEYGNWIYLTPMMLGGAATVLAAAWKFLGLGRPRDHARPARFSLRLGRRIRKAGAEAELSDIEEEIDGILSAQRTRSAEGDENAVDDATLNVAAHRLEGLIHDRRKMLAERPAVASAA